MIYYIKKYIKIKKNCLFNFFLKKIKLLFLKELIYKKYAI